MGPLEDQPSEETSQQSTPREDGLLASNMLYLSNLPYDVTSTALATIVAEGADTEPVNIEMLKKGKPQRLRNSGLAAVTYRTAADALHCQAKLHMLDIGDRKMHASLRKFT